jgi:hypothetical protein
MMLIFCRAAVALPGYQYILDARYTLTRSDAFGAVQIPLTR